MADRELWHRVKGFDHYEVSNQGRVRSWRSKSGRAIDSLREPRVLRTQLDATGWVFIKLQSRGTHRTICVGKLVLATFVRPPHRSEIVGYRNGDKSDVRLANLFWTTRTGAAHQSKLLGHRATPIADLTAEERREIVRAAAGQETKTAIAKRYNLHRATLNRLIADAAA